MGVARKLKNGTPTFDNEFGACFLDMTCSNCKEIDPYIKIIKVPFPIMIPFTHL
jgi:hypothetical protein